MTPHEVINWIFVVIFASLGALALAGAFLGSVFLLKAAFAVIRDRINFD